MQDLSETLELLAARVDALEKRVRDLEQSPASAPRQSELRQPATTISTELADLPSSEQISGAFLLLGKCMLGIAGAYLLRALAASGVLPRPLIAALAILYAIGWLVAASRTRASARFAPSMYAGTSALILAPMLWELTMRFQVLAPAAAAAVLGLVAAVATALTWKRKQASDFLVAYAAVALTALALSVVTHVMISFLVLLLVMLAVCEYKSLRSSAQGGVRALVAVVTDCAVWFLIVIYRNPASTRTDYPPLGTIALVLPATLLFLITATSVVTQTAVLRRKITVFETIQSVTSFLLWIITLLFLVPQFTPRIVGIVCLVFASACYAAAWGMFRPASELRNFHVFALWSVSLLLSGIYLSLPPAWAVACLAIAAILSAVIAVRICCITLQSHGIIYLTVAVVACGLLEYSFQALAGTMPVKVSWSIFLVSACALVCYIAAREREGESWQRQVLHLVPALFAVGAIAGLTAQGSLLLVALRIAPAAFHVAFIRTLILCATALVLAFAGSRWRRPEMTRIAYAALVLVAAKLFFEDLRHGQMEFIAGSIFLFAVTLIGVPRLARIGRTV
jgi:hypothetical protein